MRKRHSMGRDLMIIFLLLAIVFGLTSLVKDATITGQTVEPLNQAPVWTGETTTFTTVKNDSFVLFLGEYFTDPDGDALTYLASEASNINLEISGQQLKITPEPDFIGDRFISVFASDGEDTTKKVITFTVLETPEEPEPEPAPEINDAIKDQNGRSVGKKVEEDYTFDTIIDGVERTPNELIVTFHHNANDELPVWVEHWANYKLSKNTALPGETITLTVPLINGIVPKFKLHVGETSDVFEFGKTIPSVKIIDDKLNAGQYQIYDRDDDYVDVELTKGESRVILNAVASEEINAKIGEIKELKTEVIAIDPIAMGGATITLEKTGTVNVIRTCEEFDTDAFTCLGKWEITDIPFTDMGDYIIFTVDHFSAYAGGTATNLTIWDDSDFSTQFVGNPLSFYANFTNATGSANNTNGSCKIRLNTTGAWGPWINMTFNATGTDIYNYTATFSTQGTPYYYEINCTGTGENLAATDAFYVYQFIPNQGLFSCTHRTGIACLPGETKVLGMSATTNAHAELANQSLYNTSICCQDLSGRNTILTTGTPFLNLSNYTNAHVALPNTSVFYPFTANISGSNDTLTCSYINDPTAPGFCTYPQSCLATISNDTNAHISDCTNNPYNWTICCGFALVPLNSTINVTKNVTPSPATIGQQMTYTITYQNLGPGTALNIAINETYPNGTNFVSANPSPSIGNNVWNIANLTAGQSGTITIILLITNSVANGTYLNNTVNVTWSNESGDNLANSANASVLALTGPAPTPRRSSGGWPAGEGARQMYEKTEEALAAETFVPSCSERWHCGEWGECSDGLKTRTCIDQNDCGTTYSKPGEVTTCVIEQPAVPAAGQAIQQPELPPQPVYTPETPEIKENKLVTILPFITYSLIILLTIALLIHLIREHFMGKETHDLWYYSLYALFALSVLSIAAELLLGELIPYPAIFAVGAIVMVFILDGILRRIANRPPRIRKQEPRTPVEKKQEKIKEDELEEIARKLKELKI
ncbi:DUF11 domain-containing protein [Candidatus Woesearchaeota archaeon]|nr:DUF11 domain-containing protein [Candidatus Woesearchaeota archaeon]